MKCSNCSTEYSNPNQVICEYCGSELSKTEPTQTQTKMPHSKIDRFLEDTGLKGLYQKIKTSLKE
jgi:DNA-directed RNA polymerase subunit RPC12/RpoP